MYYELLKFEWRFHSRKFLFLIGIAAFLFFGFVFSAFGMKIPNININGPYLVAHATGLLSLGGIFTITLFTANALLRDKEATMTALIYSSPINKWQYLSSRFAGAYIAAFVIQACASAGIFFASFSPTISAEKLGDISFLNYLWPLLTMSTINLLICAAVVFLTATITRNRIAIYVAGILIYVFYIVGSIFSNAPWLANASPATAEAMSLAAKLDPFGLAAFYEQTNYWTPLEKNSNLLSLSGNFLINRIIWLGIAVGLFFTAFRMFSFRTFGKRGKQAPQADMGMATTPYGAIKTNPEKAWWPSTLSLIKIEFTTVLKGLPFLVIILFWIFILGTEAWAMVDGGSRTPPYYATTGRMITNLKEVISFLGIMVIIFYSNEQIWRDHDLKLSSLLDASPTSNLSFYISKYIVLTLVPIALIGSGILVSICIQIAFGYFKFEPLLYLSLFYYAGLPLFLVAALALFIQSLIPNKYAGMAITAIIIAVTNVTISGLFGIRHQLLQFATPLVEVDYSDFNGFGHYANAFHWRMLYWGGFAGICALLTYGLWRRGNEHNLLLRLKLLHKQLQKSGVVIAIVCVFAFFGAGSYIFYHTNVRQTYTSREDNRQWMHDYEIKYKPYENDKYPVITAVNTAIDLHPEDRIYQVKATYTIKNKEAVPITNTIIGISRLAKISDLKIVGASLDKFDNRFNQYQFNFDRPLLPGEEREMTFSFHSDWNGFTGHSPFNAIVGNGSFMRISRYYPYFGYDSGNELSNPDVRQAYGLPTQEGMAKLVANTTNSPDSTTYDYDFLDFEAIVSTTSNQTAIVPGNLIKQWSDDDRNYFHYKMDRPTGFRFAVSSAQYKEKKVHHNGVEIAVYYHPDHDYNIDRFLSTAKKSLDYCIQNFGPYPYQQLRLVQISNFTRGFGATAYPNTIYIREDMGFISDHRKETDIDLITQLMAHEISHQWWGGQIDPETMEGAIVLTETLAQYTELMVYEQVYDKKHVMDALNVELNLYLRAKGLRNEQPLYKAIGGRPFVAYSKGAKILYAIKTLIGEDQLNSVLKKLMQRFAYPKAPPTTYDLLALLYEATPQPHHQLIDEWMKKIIIFDLKMEEVAVEPLANGQYKVDLAISISKKEDDGLGNTKPATINEAFEIGLFVGNRHGIFEDQNIVYLEKHHFNSEHSKLSLVVDQRPDLVGIDPYVIAIDTDRMNNLKSVNE